MKNKKKIELLNHRIDALLARIRSNENVLRIHREEINELKGVEQ